MARTCLLVFKTIIKNFKNQYPAYNGKLRNFKKLGLWKFSNYFQGNLELFHDKIITFFPSSWFYLLSYFQVELHTMN